MIADDSDAVTVRFLRMMRAEIGAEGWARIRSAAPPTWPGAGWGTGAAADARLADALRELHGEPVDLADPHVVSGAASALRRRRAAHRAGPTRRGDRPFAANARRLRSGEITPAEFDELMARDRSDPDA
ncbi:hypothetical protein [Micromonospora sp. b486]|uniref:hypothetical protein n=1 Tax=Micromonospora sp. b486 TaxID=3053986 RepID=UPI00259D0ED4|nr:hypothetical protein [Micromonospora sp. b486]MDM4784513.1 hypothetical protein [Micromonospora sp. b486]